MPAEHVNSHVFHTCQCFACERDGQDTFSRGKDARFTYSCAYLVYNLSSFQEPPVVRRRLGQSTSCGVPIAARIQLCLQTKRRIPAASTALFPVTTVIIFVVIIIPGSCDTGACPARGACSPSCVLLGDCLVHELSDIQERFINGRSLDVFRLHVL